MEVKLLLLLLIGEHNSYLTEYLHDEINIYLISYLIPVYKSDAYIAGSFSASRTGQLSVQAEEDDEQN